MNINDIQKKLNSINWNFDFNIDYSSSKLHPFNCRKYYSYPATFIPEIPYALIEILSNVGDTVLDPFGGIGTTFMQALSLERIPYSFDINPIATAVCKSLYTLFNPHNELKQMRGKLLNLCNDYNCNLNYRANLSLHRMELSNWFEKNTFNELAYLIHEYDKLENETEKDAMRLILSGILVTLSSQNKGWAYIADNVKPKADELRKKRALDQFRSSTNSLFSDVSSHLNNLTDSYKTFYSKTTIEPHIFQRSIIESNLADRSVDLIITSPPYPRMIDYVKSQRLSFAFYNEDFHDYTENEIGARYRRSRHDALKQYETSIEIINKKMYELLKCGGYLCLVLPNYEDNDNRKETMDKVVNTYYRQGYTNIFEIGRYIPSHKRTLSIQWASLVNERLFVFQKG